MQKSSNIIISIVVPVYGAEKYIERCARSLFEQTMTEGIEFIFVNDCTPDNSIGVLKQILAQYPYREQQTVIIEQPRNMGPDCARKTGAEKARGEYVAFCDSDDWVEKDAYKLVSEKAVQNDLDMVVCNYYIQDGLYREYVRHQRVYSNKELANSGMLRLQLSGIIGGGGVVDKITKRKFFKDMIAPQSNMGEDLLMSVQLCYRCQKIGYIHTPIYHYLFNAGSLSRKITEESAIKLSQDYKKNIDIIIEYLKQTGVYEKYKYDISIYKLRCRGYIAPYIDRNYDLWKSVYPELDTWKYFWRIPWRYKIKHIIIYLHLYKLYPFLQKLSRRLK